MSAPPFHSAIQYSSISEVGMLGPLTLLLARGFGPSRNIICLSPNCKCGKSYISASSTCKLGCGEGFPAFAVLAELSSPSLWSLQFVGSTYHAF